LFRKLRFLSFLMLAVASSGYAQAPAPVISVSSTSGCPQLAVSFTDTESGTNTYSWNFGGTPPNVSMATSTKKTNVVFFDSSGTYTVTLTVTNASGSTTATPVKINVYPVPTADFSTDKSTGCAPTTIHFTNLSPGPINSFIWDFGDGTQNVTNLSPSHLYKTADAFRVVLYVTNSFGCTGKKQIKNVDNAIVLSGVVVPNFSSTLNSSCALPVNAIFNSSSSGPGTLSYNWNFGDGGGYSNNNNSNPSYSYSTAGLKNVSLAVTSNQGCTDTLTLPVNISASGNVTDFKMPDTVCINSAVNIKNLSSPPPNLSVWDYGDGSGLDTTTKVNHSHTFTTLGKVTVTLSNTFNGCNGVATHVINVVGPPVLNFTGTNITSCKAPLTSTFTDNTPGALGWSWNFGDGTTSPLKNPPPHTYTNEGIYTVTLIASSATGCSTSGSDTVKIQKPTVDLIGLPAYGCAPATINVSANANTVDGVAFYTWDFVGNGGSSNAQTPPSQLYGPGSSPVFLTVTTNGGCQAIDTGFVKVGTVKPSAAFTIAPPISCINTPIVFTDGSSGGANQWFWSFGDGAIDSTHQSTTHPFGKIGTFNVKLIAYNNGCSDSIVHPVTINGPSAGFTFSTGCGSSNTFTFVDTSHGATSWQWDFGDGTLPVSGQFPTAHTFPTGPSKTYSVTLTVSSSVTGCTDHVTLPVTANQSAQIVFSQNPTCANTLIYLTAIPTKSVQLYKFDLGDGSPINVGSSASIGYTYKKPGVYMVTVTTQDISGCNETSGTFPLVVNGPIANYSIPTALSCDTMTFDFKSLFATAPGTSGIKSYVWDFGDGTSSILLNPSHLYGAQGVYQPILTLTDNFGCVTVNDTSQPIVVSVMVPKFSTSDSNYCPTSGIQFNNTSVGGFNPIYTWNFGDGSPLIHTVAPIHTYPMVGKYTDTLTMNDFYGCIKKFWNTTKLNIDTPSATFTMSGNYSACPPFNDTFHFTGHYADKFSWNFGNLPPSFAFVDSPKFLYTDPGDYDVVLKVTSFGGCIATSAPQHVHIDGPIGAFSYTPIAGCESLDVKFHVASSNVVNFTWIFGDGSNPAQSNSPDTTYHYGQPGQFQPYVTLVDAAGCHITKTGTDVINVDHITQTIFTADKSIVCDAGAVLFTDKSILGDSTHITKYNWDFNDGSPIVSGLYPTISHTYNGIGNYTVTLHDTTLGGCTGTYSLPIQVVPSPKITVTGIVSQCEPAILTFNGVETTPDPNGPLTWAWNFGNTQTGTGANPPNVSYPKAGEYVVSVIATDAKGCSTMSDTTSLNHLFVYPIPTVNAGPDVTICDTSNIQLNATGNATSYTWSTPAGGNLSCTVCTNPIASSPVSTFFVVQGLSLKSCQARDTVQVTVNTPFTMGISGPDSVCLGQSSRLNATGAAIYTWTPAEGLSDPNISNPIATPDANQIGNQASNVITYSVTGYDNKKCYSDTKTVNITAFNYPEIAMVPNVTINVGSSYRMSPTVSTNILSYNWTPSNTLSCANCLMPIATPTITTRYALTATNDGGCAKTDSIRIQVICNGANFFVPNTFSPNGDGVNDYFIVNGVGLNVIPSITIYNRWGQIVFQKSNFAANSSADAWDGTFNGQPAPADVYVYTIQILCNNATLIPYHGNITLIR